MTHLQKVDWERSYKRQRDYKWLTTAQLSYILRKSNAPRKGKVLDVGCGTGQVCRDLFHHGYEVYGVDLSEEAIKEAKESTMYEPQGITFFVHDIESFSFKQDKLALVFCKYVFAFLEDKEAFLRYISRKIRSDGKFVLISPNLGLLPENKRNIGMQHEIVLAQLENNFGAVQYEKVGGDDYYYCGLA